MNFRDMREGGKESEMTRAQCFEFKIFYTIIIVDANNWRIRQLLQAFRSPQIEFVSFNLLLGFFEITVWQYFSTKSIMWRKKEKERKGMSWLTQWPQIKLIDWWCQYVNENFLKKQNQNVDAMFKNKLYFLLYLFSVCFCNI